MRHNPRHNRRKSYLYRCARRRIRPPGASAAVSLRAPPELVPSLPISSAPQPPRTSARGEACAPAPALPLLVPCVRQLCPASAGARACALGRLIDIGKRLHSASRTAAKKRIIAALRRRRSPRPRPAGGDDYTITHRQACRNVSHPANLASLREGSGSAIRSEQKAPASVCPSGCCHGVLSSPVSGAAGGVKPSRCMRAKQACRI